MKQIFHPYTKWEDYKNGMWRKVDIDTEKSMLTQAITFIGNHLEYGKAMIRVINEWKITCEHNLTDNSINQKAFIGHCAVCLQLGIPEYITRMAWHHLTEKQQIDANKMADIAIKEWNKINNDNNTKYQQLNLF